MKSNIKKLELQHPNWILVIIGACILIIGFLLLLTIIGILPGFGLMMIGYIMMCKKYNCKECNKVAFIPLLSTTYKCKECNTVYKLSWK